MSPDAWAFFGVAVTAVAGITVELIRRGRRDRKVHRAAEQVTEAATTVRYEFSPNEGKSLRDAIDRIERTQRDILDRQEEHGRRQQQHGERLAGLEGAVRIITSRWTPS